MANCTDVPIRLKYKIDDEESVVTICNSEGGRTLQNPLEESAKKLEIGESCQVPLVDESNPDITKLVQLTRIELEPHQNPHPRKKILQVKIQAALKLKLSGNRFFKSKKFAAAAKMYEKAIQYLDVPEGCNYSKSDLEHLNPIKVLCYLNLAACCLNLENKYISSIEYCNKILEIQPSNVKALYRRAQAFYKDKDYSSAKKDVGFALEVDPNNKALSDLQKRVHKSITVQKKKELATFRGIF